MRNFIKRGFKFKVGSGWSPLLLLGYKYRRAKEINNWLKLDKNFRNETFLKTSF